MHAWLDGPACCTPRQSLWVPACWAPLDTLLLFQSSAAWRICATAVSTTRVHQLKECQLTNVSDLSCMHRMHSLSRNMINEWTHDQCIELGNMIHMHCVTDTMHHALCHCKVYVYLTLTTVRKNTRTQCVHTWSMTMFVVDYDDVS